MNIKDVIKVCIISKNTNVNGKVDSTFKATVIYFNDNISIEQILSYSIDSATVSNDVAYICYLLKRQPVHMEATNEKSNDKTEHGEENGVNIVDGAFKVSGYGYRHQQCLVLFVCLATAYSMRACIGVALVGMIDKTIHDIANFNETTNIHNESLLNTNHEVLTNNSKETDEMQIMKHGGFLHALLLIPPYPKFTWSKKVQDVVISSFFWGYMVLQIPAGQLVHRFGPHRLLVGALSINGAVSILFPWAAYYGGWILAVIFRMLQGLSQACVIPGMYGFFGQWTVLEERSRLVGFAVGGQAIGTVMGLPMTGYLAASSLGWPGIFRFYGILSLLVAFLVYYTITDTPAQHPKISVAERRYIEEGLGLKYGEKKKRLPVPWKKILGSRAIYMILISHISQTWGQLILFAEIPSFMDKVMGVNIKSNGLLTALPFFVMWFTNFFFNWFTDMIIVKKYMNVTNARKLANTMAFPATTFAFNINDCKGKSILLHGGDNASVAALTYDFGFPFILKGVREFGSVPAAIGLVVLAYAPKNVYVVEGILIFICAFKISMHVGSMVTHIDIAPNFAGTMMSISNFMSNLFGSMAPVVTGLLLNDVTSEYEWRKVFFLAAGLYFFTNLVYVMFGTAERAPWNDPDEESGKDASEMEAMVKVVEKNHTNH